MGAARTVIHCNPGLKHQVELAECLRSGIPGSEVRNSPDAPADLHIVIGPWYALEQWRHAKTLYIDRAYWDDPECVSVHWLEQGEKLLQPRRRPRPRPALQPERTGNRRIYLCDYLGKPDEQCDSVRWHPAERKTDRTLEQDLATCDIARGRRTTALVDAAIAGLKVETDDPHSPIYPLTQGQGRMEWINSLAWHNWSRTEISRGDMWAVFQS